MSTFYEDREEKYFIGEMTHFPFSTHVHELVEVLSLTSGGAEMQIGDGRYSLEPGDLALIFPLVPHSYEILSPNVGGLVAIFPPGLVPEYAGAFQTMLPEKMVFRAEELDEEVREAVRRLRDLSVENDLPRCAAWLHVLLAGVMHQTGYRSVHDYNTRSLGYRIMQYVSDHCCEEITLQSTARAMGISSSHLSHFFSQKLHISFRRFVNAQRIGKARAMMRNPALTLTMISGACGYANMRTFRRAFLQETGMLPSEHMQTLKNRVMQEAE